MTGGTIRGAIRPAGRRVAAALTGRWSPYSRLFFVGEGRGWVIDEEQRAIGARALDLGIRLAGSWPLASAQRQSVFYGSHFTLLGQPPIGRDNRIATTYFHGRPGTPGMPEFDEAFTELRRRRAEVDRVQVSHREMETLVLEGGIAPEKVFLIPIGLEPRYFRPRDAETRRVARSTLGLPDGAFVVGSFQKDGVGWEGGHEPKLIKGPDILVKALALVRHRVPELHVLLSGPARGYVRAGLERHGIPYVHRTIANYEDVASLYHAIDAYAVTSRQEGGPKAVLESMASAVPIVSTRVGQATDLIRDGENGWLVDVDDVEAIADRLAHVAEGGADVERVAAAGPAVAAAHAYDAQLPLWRAFFDGFVATA